MFHKSERKENKAPREKEKKERKKINFKALLKNRIVLSIAAISFSAILIFGGSTLMDKVRNSAADVVRAKIDLPKGTLITADMLETVRVGSLGLPIDVTYDIGSVTGKYTGVDIWSGDTLVMSKVASELPFENPVLYSLPQDKYAISVSLNTVAASISAKVRAGDVVSIFSTPLEADYDTENYISFAPDELRYVEVIAVSAENGADIRSNEDITAENGSIPQTVTLVVNREQAAILAGLEQTGQMHLALATRNTEQKQALLKIQEEYFEDKIEESKTENEGGITND